jgi:HPt (histidine-containing phosphotransfer) domain-containing protein
MFKIDLTYLETISGGDQSFIHELLNMLLNSTFTEVAILTQHAKNEEWSLLGSTAHKIKAPVQMLGVKEVSTLIEEIEQQGKNQKDTASIPAKVELLERYMADLQQQVEELLKA